jgi:predicted KAP-like P-loop ATPase
VNAAVAEAAGVARDYKLLLDIPSEKPALGFEEKAAALAEIVAVSDPQFAIGVFGGWGSGKTTLMQAIERELDQEHVLAVRFTAWRYEREEHLIVPLLDTIREAVVSWAAAHPEWQESARRVALTIGRVARSILTGLSMKVGAPGAVQLSFEANKMLEAQQAANDAEADERVPRSFYHASFSALRDAFEGFTGADERRIVVFVDDLDRCLPESALQVLESMKLFFDLEGFVFVVGLDHEVVEHTIDAKYQRPVADWALAHVTQAKHSASAGPSTSRRYSSCPTALRPSRSTSCKRSWKPLMMRPAFQTSSGASCQSG